MPPRSRVTSAPKPPRKQKGAVLIVSLLFVLILALIGMSASQTASLELRMSANSRDGGLAFQAAEAALVDAESYLSAEATLPPFDGSSVGLFRAGEAGEVPVWLTVNWQPSDSQTYSGVLEGVGEQPRYIIEQLPPMPMPGGSLQSNVPLTETGWYRITARGVGTSKSASVSLQSIYKR